MESSKKQLKSSSRKVKGVLPNEEKGSAEMFVHFFDKCVDAGATAREAGYKARGLLTQWMNLKTLDRSLTPKP